MKNLFYGLTGGVLALVAAVACGVGLFHREHPSAARPSQVESFTSKASWTAAVQEHIRHDERQATFQKENSRWHLVNREAGLRAYVNSTGIEFHPRHGNWSVRMDAIVQAAGNVRGADTTILADRGTIEERLENREGGLEHSFLVREGPAGPFEIKMTVQTSGITNVRAEKDRLLFSADAMPVMEYRDLHVTDAGGKTLAARMNWHEGQVGLEVLEAGTYPILVDPVVMAPLEGAQPIETAPSTTSIEEAQLGVLFGWKVAAAGDVNGDGYSDVLVAAPNYDGGTFSGRVYLFYGSAGGLATTPAWVKNGINPKTSIAGAGDVNGDGYADVIIGEPFATPSEGTSNPYEKYWAGEASVYLGSASGLASTPAWKTEGAGPHNYHGMGVASAGDVNKDGYSDIIVSGGGYVKVYLGGPNGPATTASWTIGEAKGNYEYLAVSGAGDVNGDGYADIIVGDPNFQVPAPLGGMVTLGRASVYHGGPTGLSTTPAWTVQGEWFRYDVNGKSVWASDTGFGGVVACAGDVNGDGYSDVIIGERPPWDCGLWAPGKVVVYHGSATGLSTTPAWTMYGAKDFDLFGFSVSSAGDIDHDGFSDVVIGSPRYSKTLLNRCDYSAEGRVYVFKGSASGLSTTPFKIFEGSRYDGHLGRSVCGAGDINKDGYADIIMGEPGAAKVEEAPHLYPGTKSRIFVSYGKP